MLTNGQTLSHNFLLPSAEVKIEKISFMQQLRGEGRSSRWNTIMTVAYITCFIAVSWAHWFPLGSVVKVESHLPRQRQINQRTTIACSQKRPHDTGTDCWQHCFVTSDCRRRFTKVRKSTSGSQIYALC